MDYLVGDMDFWLRVVSFLTPVEMTRVAHVSSVVHRAVAHDAKYIRPKKQFPDHLALTRKNCAVVNKAFDAGVRSFTLAGLKIPVGAWYYRTLTQIGLLPIRRISVDVLAIHYRNAENIKHDCLVARSLVDFAFLQTLESLVVKICSDVKTTFPVTGMTGLEEFRTTGPCARVRINVVPSRIRVLEATVPGDMIVQLLCLPFLEKAILVVEGVVHGGTAASPLLSTLVLRASDSLGLSVHAIGLRYLKLCVRTAYLVFSGAAKIHAVSMTGHVWPGRRVCLDLGGARVEHMRIQSQDLCNVVNIRPECLTIESYNNMADIAPGNTILITAGCQLQVQVFGSSCRPVFATDFLEKLAHMGVRLEMKRVVIRDQLAVYLYMACQIDNKPINNMARAVSS